MSRFMVTFTQCDTHTYMIEADNETEAKEKAYDKFLNNLCYFKPDADYEWK